MKNKTKYFLAVIAKRRDKNLIYREVEEKLSFFCTYFSKDLIPNDRSPQKEWQEANYKRGSCEIIREIEEAEVALAISCA